jgi:hypothetical protein
MMYIDMKALGPHSLIEHVCMLDCEVCSEYPTFHILYA